MCQQKVRQYTNIIVLTVTTIILYPSFSNTVVDPFVRLLVRIREDKEVLNLLHGNSVSERFYNESFYCFVDGGKDKQRATNKSPTFYPQTIQ